METHVRRKISAVLLAALFLGWGAALAYADGAEQSSEPMLEAIG